MREADSLKCPSFLCGARLKRKRRSVEALPQELKALGHAGGYGRLMPLSSAAKLEGGFDRRGLSLSERGTSPKAALRERRLLVQLLAAPADFHLMLQPTEGHCGSGGAAPASRASVARRRSLPSAGAPPGRCGSKRPW